jgi:hypothetical protein
MEQNGFFGGLFDFSFTKFITIRIVKVLFIIMIVLAGLWTLGLLISLVREGAGPALLGLIIAPLMFFFSVLMARVWLEVIVVLFRIAENTSRFVELEEQKNKTSDSSE